MALGHHPGFTLDENTKEHIVVNINIIGVEPMMFGEWITHYQQYDWLPDGV